LSRSPGPVIGRRWSRASCAALRKDPRDRNVLVGTLASIAIPVAALPG
jgi:hypothetical protein